MLATGFTKRSISDQVHTFGYNIDVHLDNVTGKCQVGVSGDRNFGFTFQNGRIYDPESRFVGAYASGEWVNISGQLGQSSYDYYINNQPVAIGNPIGSGKYSWVYVNPAGVTADTNIQIYGEPPQYEISPTGNYYGSGYAITGHIVNLNPDVKFRVFDIVQTSDSPYTLNGFTTGDITGVGNFYLTSNKDATPDVLLPLRFYTNFGNIDVQYAIVGHQPLYSTVYLTLSPFEGAILNGRHKLFTAYVANYPYDAEVSVSLEYVSGVTGNIYQSVSVTNPKTKTISGFVSGSQALFTYYTGVVSGVDPKTSLVETGQGTGYLWTAVIEPTGQVSQPYVVEGSGYGEGSSKGNFYAKGTGTATTSGDVGIMGDYSSPVVVANVTGTGFVPFYHEGVIPKATGQAYLHPTGLFRLTTPLYAESGHYISGNIEVSKVYEGWLYKDYVLLAVGYATGAYVTGKVTSRFNLDFEQGYYIFSKNFSGIVSGESVTMESFDPARCEQESKINSGILVGTYHWPPNANPANISEGGYLDCLQLTGLPSIRFTGVPNVVYGEGIIDGLVTESDYPLDIEDGDPLYIDESGHSIVAPNHYVALVIPSGGFGAYETSQSVLTGYLARTRTSRMGVTPSGTGYFKDIIQECLYTAGAWRESLQSFPTGIGLISENDFESFSAQFQLKAPLGKIQESGLMSFSILGQNTTKRVAIRGLGPSIISGAENLDLTVYRNGVPYNYNDNWITGDNTSYLDSRGIAPAHPYDAALVMDLPTGHYKVYARYLPAPIVDNELIGDISFGSSSVYVEEGQNAYIPVVRKNGSFSSLSINYVTMDGTAKSGIDYTATSGVLTFAHHEDGIKYIQVPTIENYVLQAPIHFGITLNAPSLSGILGLNNSTVNINDNDTCCPPPTIDVVFPTEESVAILDTTVNLEALITSENEVISVSFYIDEALIGTATEAPYRISWIPTEAGMKTLRTDALIRCVGCPKTYSKVSLFRVADFFDHVILKYKWTAEGGTDLDTRTSIVNLISGSVGFCRSSTVGDYLIWGGDNTDLGGEEQIWLKYAQLHHDFPSQDVIEIRFAAVWFGVKQNGFITVEAEGYSGGTFSPTGHAFDPDGALSMEATSKEVRVTTQSTACDAEDYCATLRIDKVAKTITFV